MRIKIRRATHRLTRIVNDKIQAWPSSHQVPAKSFDARCVAKIQSENLQAITPFCKVRFGCITFGGVTRKTSRDNERCSGAQQFDPRLVADFHTTSGEQRNAPTQISCLTSFAVVQL